jgi:FkbM family methyltransferase
VDIGAHIGLYALYVIAAAPKARIVAIEPVPALFEALRRNTAAYAEQISYYCAAAGKEDGNALLTYYPKLSGMSSLRSDPVADAALLRTIIRNLLQAQPELESLLHELDEIVSERLGSDSIECSVRRLEKILDEAAPDRIDILKIDVQRYEEPVLSGVGSAWPRVRQVVVEVHDENGALIRIDEFLRGQGFTTITSQLSVHLGTTIRFIVGRR